AERTGLPYASAVQTVDGEGHTVGVMHACGHDVHMTALVGAARRLGAMRAQWKGTLVLVAQPAEERGGGAKAMIEDGLFTRFPRPDFNVCLHRSEERRVGKGRRWGWSLCLAKTQQSNPTYCSQL